MTNSYTIKDLSQLTHIKPHTLRVWEQRYGMMKPERTDTNIRIYTKDDLKYLLNVSILYDNGFKISKIARMTNTELSEEVTRLSLQSVPFTTHVSGLVMAMVELNEDQFEKILSTVILSFGLEETMIKVMFPFLQHVGILWLTNTINPAQEHFISNLIRQKLIVAIDGLTNQLKPDFKRFILFLPEGELHEIGLLFTYFMVKARGHKVVYLGQSLPLADLAEVHKIYHADVVMTAITSKPSMEDVPEYLDAMFQKIPGANFWVTGAQAVGCTKVSSNRCTIIQTIAHLKEMLSQYD